MSDSPASVLVHPEGEEIPVKSGATIDAALPVAGSDGGTARLVQVDSTGRVAVTGAGTAGVPAGGVVSIQGVASGTPLPISGSVSGNMTIGVISGEIDSNQGLPNSAEFRWPVGISDGTDFVGTQANPIKVGDDFSGGEVLAQQSGANAVLVFTFSATVNLVFVESSGVGLTSRADPFGGVPTSTLGVPCRDEQAREFKVNTSLVRVYAPTGTTVNVWGFRR